MDQRYSVLGFPEKLDGRQRFLPYALLLAVTFALYGATLYFNFVWDDLDYIVENYQIQGLSLAHLRSIWRYPFSGQYAPLHHNFLALLYFVSELKPIGYHLAQVLLHASCVCLLYFVLREIESGRVAFLASLLFAVFPANIETVAWVSETKSTLALLFFLLSFWAFLRLRACERWRYGAWSAFLLALSLLAKINTVVAPAIFLLYDYRQAYSFKKSRAWTLAVFFLISVIFFGITLFYTSSASLAFPDRLVDGVLRDNGSIHHADSNGYYGGVYVHLLNLPRLFLFYLRMTVFPRPLSAWHMLRIYESPNWVVAVSWFSLLALLFILYLSPRNIQFWGLWFVVFLIPVLQVLPNPVWVADRYLYVPAIGAFVLLSKLFFWVLDGIGNLWPRLAWEAGMLAVLLTFTWQTYQHVPVWRNELTLWTDAMNHCPTSALCHARLGKALLRAGYSDLAIKEFVRAVEIRPSPQYLIYLGDAYTDDAGDYQRGLAAYKTARESGPLPLFYWAKVAKAYYLSGDFKEATRIIEAGQKLDADDPGLLLVNGFVQWKQGNREQARRALQRLMALNTLYPRTPDAAAKFINHYWEHPAEAGQLLADLGPL